MTRVLIFGDSTLDIQGLRAVLHEQGYESTLVSRPWDQMDVPSVEDSSIIFIDVPFLHRAEKDVGPIIQRCRARSKARLLALLSPDNSSDFDVASSVDDFITYPYNRHELLARVENLLDSPADTKREQNASGPNTLTRGRLVVNQDSYEVWVGRDKIELTYKEYELLRLLALNPGKVFPRHDILDRVWGYNYFGGTRTVDMHVRRLRSKIEAQGQPFIETVRGVGYRFTSET